MSERKKGFDPLSSLFDAPDPGAVKQDVAPTPVDITKPERRIAVPPPPPPPSIPASLEMEDAPTEMAMMSEVENRSDLNEEVAGAGPLKKRPSESTKVEFIGELPASDDWTESKPEALFSLNQLPVPDPDEEAAPRYGQRMSRVERLAARAVRPKSALEAAREAALVESEAEERASQTLTDRIQVLIEASLPGIGTVDVKAAKVADERDVLLALWKAHRSKFLGDGQLERAVAAARVVDSLKHAPDGALLAAHAVTDASDYLVWIDLQNGSLVAAFADARSYFAG
jgi:beta-phosphoglucomutase-like phosphatase (HAD superfamily)